jgi:hypothetical protein
MIHGHGELAAQDAEKINFAELQISVFAPPKKVSINFQYISGTYH